MAVYLNASGGIWAENCKSRLSSQLSQSQHLPYFAAFESPLLDLTALYALLEQQIERCLEQAGWQQSEMSQIPILLGSTAYVAADCEYRWQQQKSLPDKASLTTIATHLHDRFGSKVYSFATSCTASAQAMGYAVKMLEQGKCDKVLVVGFEPFNRLTFEHFQSMGLLAQQPDEQGIRLGEGLGCLALSREPSACAIEKMASLTDYHNLTNSNLTALEQLVSQILQGERVEAVKPHLVGGLFDTQEQHFLQQHFADTLIFEPKKQLGHTLGASGVLETAWLLDYLQKNHINRPLAILNYFLGFGGANIGWVLQWKP